jgi:CubicO group peptidase (beta-lactamase class C family)
VRALDLVSRWHADAAAAVVARGGAGDAPQVVDVAGDTGRPFAWASVTKLLVAMAVLVAVEEGTISLDEPAGPSESTVRHLLAHASGLGPVAAVPLTRPGRMRIYSNIGYEVLAETLAQHARMPFTDYLTAGVVDPLGMTGTALAPGSSPAWGAQGPLRDLLALATELLAPRLISADLLATASAVVFRGMSGVLPGWGRFDPCDWGLGFEVKGAKAPHWTGTRTTAATFGHFGRSGGFLWIDPTSGLACATLSDRDFGPWAVTAWPELSDAVVEEWGAAGGGGGPASGHLERLR